MQVDTMESSPRLAESRMPVVRHRVRDLPRVGISDLKLSDEIGMNTAGQNTTEVGA